MVSLMPYFRIGSKVEVAGSDEGFLGSWYEAIIVKRDAKHCMVKYCNLLGDASDQPLVERHSMSLIRPLPPVLPVEAYEEGDAVEAYDRDGWWVGTVCKVLLDDKCVVYFRESGEEIEYHTSKMRLRQDWLNGIWIRVYERRNPTLEAFRKQGILGATPKVLKSSSKASAKLAGLRKGLHDFETELELESDFPEAPRRKKLKATSSDELEHAEFLPSPKMKKKLLPELVHRKQQLEKSDRASGGEGVAKLPSRPLQKPVLEHQEHGKGREVKLTTKQVDLESPNSCARPRKGSDLSSECTPRSTHILAYSSVLKTTSSDEVEHAEFLPSAKMKKKLLPELVHRKQQWEKSDRASGGEDAAKLPSRPQHQEHGKGREVKLTSKQVDLKSPNSCARPRKGSELPSECTLRSTQILAYSSVLRAFHLQGPGLTWQQEQLITDLRCQLQIGLDVHIKELESLDGWECRCHCSNCSRKVYGTASGRQCMQV